MVRSTKTVDPISQVVGRRIRLKRELMGLSQTELGKKIGASRIKIGKFEAGTSEIPASTLFKLSKLFNVDTCYFFEDGELKQAFKDLAEIDPALNEESIALIKDFSSIENHPDLQKGIVDILCRAAQLLGPKQP